MSLGTADQDIFVALPAGADSPSAIASKGSFAKFADGTSDPKATISIADLQSSYTIRSVQFEISNPNEELVEIRMQLMNGLSPVYDVSIEIM